MADSGRVSSAVLTTGFDVIDAAAGEALLVRGTSTTLTTTDRLTGGTGYDVLSLTGPGSFDLSKLATFSNFEEVQLTNTTSTFTSLTLRDGMDVKVVLSDGTTGNTSVYTPGWSISVQLAAGRVDLQGGNESDNISVLRPANLVAGSVIDGGKGYDSLSLSFEGGSSVGAFDPKTGFYTPPVYRDSVYDLTSLTLKNVESLSLSSFSGSSGGKAVVVKVDGASLADITSVFGSTVGSDNNYKLLTAEANLDLTGKSVRNVMIESGNASGTVFTTDIVQTALQVVGGVGPDKVVVTGATLTEAQRDQIFSNSVETIQDASGSYQALQLPGTALTIGADTVTTTVENSLVSARARMLNAEDNLTGATAHDVLSLIGSGSFDLSKLAAFSGFEEVRLKNATSSDARLILRDGMDMKVVLSDGATGTPSSSSMAGRISVQLNGGRVDLQGGNEYDFIWVSQPAKLVAGSVIDGGNGPDVLALEYDSRSTIETYDPQTEVHTPPVYRDSVYDLTTLTLKHVETLTLTNYFSSRETGGTSLVVKIDGKSLTDVTSIYGFVGGGNLVSKLVTADANLDLTGKTVREVLIESSNASGTVFTTDSVQTALQIVGGVGSDKVVVTGKTLTEAQRAQIFSNSVETIQDASGTTTAVHGQGGALQQVVFEGVDGSIKTDRYATDGTTKLSQTYIHDGIREEHAYVVTGKPYAKQDAVYDKNDKLLSMERYDANGKLVFEQIKKSDGSQTITEGRADGTKKVTSFGTDGKLAAIDQVNASGVTVAKEERGADGSKTFHTFDATSGKELTSLQINADKSRVETNHAVQNKPYAEQTQSFDVAGRITEGVRKYADGTVSFSEKYSSDGSAEVHSYDTAGRETLKLLTASDGSKDVFQFAYAGADKAPATAVQTHFGAGNVKQWTDATNADGSHVQTAYASGVTLTSHETVADTFTGFKGGADTFVFASGFGKDVVKGFEAGSGAVHDLLRIDDSLASSFADLQSHMTKVGGDTLISFEGDTILLKGVAPTALTADNVQFVHHDLLVA